MSRTWLKWMPAVAVPAVIVAGVLAVPLQAGAAVDLPEKTPQDVLELAAGSTVDTFSGTLEQTSELGLPEIPSTGDAAAGDLADALDLLTGDHTVRVYQNGAEQSRVQVQDTMSERNLIRNGSDVWLYDSADNTAVHTTLPADAAPSDGAETRHELHAERTRPDLPRRGDPDHRREPGREHPGGRPRRLRAGAHPEHRRHPGGLGVNLRGLRDRTAVTRAGRRAGRHRTRHQRRLHHPQPRRPTR